MQFIIHTKIKALSITFKYIFEDTYARKLNNQPNQRFKTYFLNFLFKTFEVHLRH